MATRLLSALRWVKEQVFEAVDADGWPVKPLPPEPVRRLYLYAVRGVNPDDPNDWESGVCLRYYGTHELDQAKRDADRARPVDVDGELQVRDADGNVWHRTGRRTAVAA